MRSAVGAGRCVLGSRAVRDAFRWNVRTEDVWKAVLDGEVVHEDPDSLYGEGAAVFHLETTDGPLHVVACDLAPTVWIQGLYRGPMEHGKAVRAMLCPICGTRQYHDERSEELYSIVEGGQTWYVIITGVPVQRCGGCGEHMIRMDVSQNLGTIREAAKAGKSPARTITVPVYSYEERESRRR